MCVAAKVQRTNPKLAIATKSEETLSCITEGSRLYVQYFGVGVACVALLLCQKHCM